MPDRLLHGLDALWWALALITGFTGGCTAAAMQAIRAKRIQPVWFFAAYGLIGVFSALVAVLFVPPMFSIPYTPETVLKLSALFGVSSPLVIAAMNVASGMRLNIGPLSVPLDGGKREEEGK